MYPDKSLLLRENLFSLLSWSEDIFLLEFLLWPKLLSTDADNPNWLGFTINTDLFPICFTYEIIIEEFVTGFWCSVDLLSFIWKTDFTAPFLVNLTELDLLLEY